MATIAAVGADMLRASASFFRAVGNENPALSDQMNENAQAYEKVAELLEADPNMEIGDQDGQAPAPQADPE